MNDVYEDVEQLFGKSFNEEIRQVQNSSQEKTVNKLWAFVVGCSGL